MRGRVVAAVGLLAECRDGALRTALGLDAANGLHGQAQATLVVGINDFDADILTDLQDIVDIVDAIVGDFRNMQQTVASGQNLHNGTEVKQTQYRAFVFLANLDVGGQFLDAAFGFTGHVQIGAGDGDHAVVGNIDLGAGFFSQGADGCATLSDHVTDLVRIDLDRQHARGEFGQFSARAFKRLFDLAQHVHAAFAGLGQR